jgi:hypothetical protein
VESVVMAGDGAERGHDSVQRPQGMRPGLGLGDRYGRLAGPGRAARTTDSGAPRRFRASPPRC